MTRLYLGVAFGWDTDATAKVAIDQLCEAGQLGVGCPKARLLKNASIRWMPNALKILGYIPVMNVIAGIVAIVSPGWALDNSKCGPHHTALWRGRGVAMIFGGPLLLVIDLIVHLYHLSIACRYGNDHPQFQEAFNSSHGHTPSYWPGHPVTCQKSFEAGPQGGSAL